MEQTHPQRTKTMPGIRPIRQWQYYKTEFGFSCKARDVGFDSFVQCLEENSWSCPYSVSYGRLHYCRCQARIYMVKKLKN